MDRPSVIDTLERMAVLLELAGENPFKVRAYVQGARALEGFEGELGDAVASGALGQVKGIGKGLFADIQALVVTGELPAYETLRAQTPPGLLDLMQIPGLGPKRVKAVYEGLGITTVGELEYACLENRLVDLPGFGEKTQAKVLKSIESWKRFRGHFLYADVLDTALALEAALAGHPAVGRVALAGALRRKLETVTDLDLVASSSDAAAVLAAFGGLPEVESVTPGADGQANARLKNGLLATLRVVAEAAWPYGLFHWTGSEAFNSAMGQRAQARGLTLDERGLWRAGERLPAADEPAIFAHLGLAFVPPELREDRGEVALAEQGPLPRLVVEEDLQGIFHVHTRFSDGEASVKDMALAARGLGFRYLGISDHSEAAAYAHGLGRDRIREQQAEIRSLNEELTGIVILSGIEADILADGSLDYDDETLAGFDFVIGSVHSRFSQDREAMTARLVKAVSYPRLTMLGHLTGRLLLARDPYDFDLDAVLTAAARHGKVIELNANPHRLDIDWRDLPKVRELGIPVSINPDAHSVEGLAHTRYGVAVARKGGLQAGEVFNGWPLERIKAYLARGRAT